MFDLFVQDGFLTQGEQKYTCAIGRSGLTHKKREGDGATPIGRFALRKVFYRADRLEKPPETHLPVQVLTPDDKWSDDPLDPKYYNQLIQTDTTLSHERLWREDNVYDVIVEVGYNDNPVLPGAGSAIFMHVACEGYSPTEGCVALALDDLLEVLKRVGPQSCLEIRE